MSRQTYELSLQECNAIIRKCRMQIARTDGAITNIKQIKKGFDADALLSKNLSARANYKARLKELIQIRNDKQLYEEEEYADI